MRKVMVFGTFDFFHPGHADFLKQARKLGDFLIVVVARDKTVAKLKSYRPVHEKTRCKTIKNTGLADKIILGRIKDKYAIIRALRPDIICLGYDQQFFIEGLEEKLQEFDLLNTKIIRLKAFCPGIYKSSKLKSRY